jgi:hypothetical protein
MVAAGIGDSNTLAYSYDGITWYPTPGIVSTSGVGGFPSSATLFTQCLAVAWSGAIWVVGGSSGISGTVQLAFSADGINWLPSSSTVFAGGQCNAVAWNGNIWVAGGSCGASGTVQLAYSPDGINWTPAQSQIFGTGGSCNTVAFTSSVFICGGGGVNQNAYSANGSIWYPINVGFTGGVCNSIVSKGSQTLAGGSAFGGNTGLFCSDTGTSGWSVARNAGVIGATINDIGWNGTQWLVGSSSGPIYSSGTPTTTALNAGYYPFATLNGDPNTAIWYKAIGVSGTSLALAWTGTRWVAGGIFTGNNGNPIYNSLDGISWTPSLNGNSVLSSCYAIASRRVLPYIGAIQAQPYFIGNAANWHSSGRGPSPPFTIPAALDLLAAYIRQSTNAAGGSPYWPT